MRILGIVALCAALGGCVSTNETISFRTTNPQQQAMMRDGQPALVSRQKNSLVLVRPLHANCRRADDLCLSSASITSASSR